MHNIFIIFFFISTLFGSSIQLIKKENPDANTTLLVIGGIHGNEPGGYFAASILATHYKILANNLWIVPNLNQASIQKNKRGIHGDMNRKFSHIKKNDKDAATVEAIKKIILNKKVSLILNLHDGHGFYRKQYQGSIFNPNAWGQTCVIDQCNLNIHQKFANLDQIAKTVRENINKKLIKKHHAFNVKNTKTKFEDEAMRKSLTFFAVTHNKPAFAIETSKNLKTLSQKVFYQLLAIEEFMNIVGIKYKKDFLLNTQELTKMLKEYEYLHINNRITLKLTNIKKTLRFIPLKSSKNRFVFTHPLGSIKRDKKGNYKVFIGNKQITLIKPEYFQLAQNCPKNFSVTTSKKTKRYSISSYFFTNDDFVINCLPKTRVNLIGYHGIKKNECSISIPLEKIRKKYSIDKKGTIYRIEFYKKDKFCAMSLVQVEK